MPRLEKWLALAMLSILTACASPESEVLRNVQGTPIPPVLIIPILPITPTRLHPQ